MTAGPMITIWKGICGSCPGCDSPDDREPLVGAGLLAKALGHSTLMSAETAPSRASPLPHWFCGVKVIAAITQITCGSELARDGAGQFNTTSQRNQLVRANSITSSPRPLITALSMYRLNPLACSSLIAGGMASSLVAVITSTSTGPSWAR